MDYQFEEKWRETLKYLETRFEQPIDLQAALFLIGVQELGKGFGTFKKDEKLALMHIAVCRILEPFGYYQFTHKDDDGWPHFNEIKKLPPLEATDQQQLIKEAVINYLEVEV
ncbi:MAG: hypothetical protein ACJAUV_000844 [Flavobacteriales bacterium]|jgi:hypothetical protein